MPRPDVSSRVSANIGHSLGMIARLRGDDREAARILFSTLSYLEEIAVWAAERGDGVEDQLADELSHQQTFAELAKFLGGQEPISPEVDALVEHLLTLRGAASLAMLNIVAESWLENVFAHLVRWPLAPELFNVVEAEEARHVERALADPAPADVVAKLLPDVERLLQRVASSPGWILPLVHLGGAAATAQMGLGGVVRHEEACARLRVSPSAPIRDLERTCRAALIEEHHAPQPWPMDAWERSKMRLWRAPEPMTSEGLLGPLPGSPAQIEAEMVRRLARAAAAWPRLNRVVRRDQLFSCEGIVVGVRRRMGPRNELIGTVFVRDPHVLTVDELAAQITRRTARAREHPYREIPEMTPALERLLPPARAFATVTHVAPLGVVRGKAPLAAIEGASISLTVSCSDDRGNYWGHVYYDHRAGDGSDLGDLAAALGLGVHFRRPARGRVSPDSPGGATPVSVAASGAAL